MKQNSLRWLSAIMIALLLLGSFTAPACADRGIDPDRSGSISMSCSYQGKPVSGGDMALYRVADVEQDDGSYFFRLRADLGGERLDQKGLDAPDLAKRLASASSLGKADQTAVFDAKGSVTFSSLKPGLYLLTQEKASAGFEKMLPVLVSLPWYDPEREFYVYDIDASVKPETSRTPTPAPSPTTPPGPNLPQTGQLNWPVPVLAFCGVLFMITGAALLLSDRSKQRREAPHD